MAFQLKSTYDPRIHISPCPDCLEGKHEDMFKISKEGSSKHDLLVIGNCFYGFNKFLGGSPSNLIEVIDKELTDDVSNELVNRLKGSFKKTMIVLARNYLDPNILHWILFHFNGNHVFYYDSFNRKLNQLRKELMYLEPFFSACEDSKNVVSLMKGNENVKLATCGLWCLEALLFIYFRERYKEPDNDSQLLAKLVNLQIN